jgi:hypothetical protein
MLASHPSLIASVDDASRAAAESLFPPDASGGAPTLKAAAAFADALGVGLEFKRLSREKDASVIRRFLSRFENNLALLISKTWVEKSDEQRKERLQARVPYLVSFIEDGEYEAALAEFGAVLDELAFLFFGSQSRKEDFTEYALRIDTQMGLFWWYGSRIRTQTPDVDVKVLRALLLIGICYLTSF